MYCPECGKEITPGAKYCTYCGEDLKEIMQMVDDSYISDDHVVKPYSSYDRSSARTQFDLFNYEKVLSVFKIIKSKSAIFLKRNLKYVIIAGVLVIAILCSIIMIPKAGKTNYNNPKNESTTKPNVLQANESSLVLDLDNISVGSHFFMGRYPQSTEEPEPIEWRVIAIEDNKAIVISEYLLDCVPYNNVETDISWADCTLRKWLNEDFYNKAFSDSEKKQILTSNITNLDNEIYGIDGGVDTEDKVYILSLDEVNRYLNPFSQKDDSGHTIYPDRMSKPTNYALQNGANIDTRWDTYEWLLRSPGWSSINAAFIRSDGEVIANGDNVSYDRYGIRPVISVSAPKKNDNVNDINNTTTFPPDLGNITVGDHFYMGRYPQNNYEPEPIEWRVLAKEDSRALVISEYLLDCVKFNESGERTIWAMCSLREWLNKDFFNIAFTDNEKDIIMLSVNDNPDHPVYRTELECIDTEDKVFCLNIDEKEKYFIDDDDRMAAPTAYAIRNGAYTSDDLRLENGLSAGWWWLRTPGLGATLVSPSGGYCNFTTSNDGMCVRPAMWISC